MEGRWRRWYDRPTDIRRCQGEIYSGIVYLMRWVVREIGEMMLRRDGAVKCSAWCESNGFVRVCIMNAWE